MSCGQRRRPRHWCGGSEVRIIFAAGLLNQNHTRSISCLAPLLERTLSAIKLHFAAMAAFVLGVVQLCAPKGTLPHRAIGWMWVS